MIDRSGCGKLIVGADKDDIVYAWRADDIGAGPIWELPLEAFDPADPMLSQLAWSASLDSLYAVTGTQLVRISIADDCSEKVEWQRPLGTHTENGSPTIAGETVWFAVNGDPQLLGYDARTGAQALRRAARRDDARGADDRRRPPRRRHLQRPRRRLCVRRFAAGGEGVRRAARAGPAPATHSSVV